MTELIFIGGVFVEKYSKSALAIENTVKEQQDCPVIASTDSYKYTICAGETVTFEVITDAEAMPFKEIEFYRFDALQVNPYTSFDPKFKIGTSKNTEGVIVFYTKDFPVNTASTATYYVYAMFNKTSIGMPNCYPFLEYKIKVRSCVNA